MLRLVSIQKMFFSHANASSELRLEAELQPPTPKWFVFKKGKWRIAALISGDGVEDGCERTTERVIAVGLVHALTCRCASCLMLAVVFGSVMVAVARTMYNRNHRELLT